MSSRGEGFLADCDVHNMATEAEIAERLEPRWREYLQTYGYRRENDAAYFLAGRPYAARADSFPEGGGLPGGDLDLMRAQLLDPYGVDIAILNPTNWLTFARQPGEFGAALCRALNDWVREVWLDADPRFRASITVPWDEPDLATAEIARAAQDDRFVQVWSHARSMHPTGNRMYWPIFEVAEELGLPVSLHVGGGGDYLTGTGWPSYYSENHLSWQQSFAGSAVSLIVEGVFDRFPGTRIVFQEGGFTWVPLLGGRLDEAVTRLGNESGLRRAPSEYLAEHFWFTTQPVEEPAKPEYLRDYLDLMPVLADRLLFSSDYPHWDFDDPDVALPKILTADEIAKIRGRNAAALYRFGAVA